MAKNARKKSPEVPRADYSASQTALLEKIERDVREHLAKKPRRLDHSLSVAREAERLAHIYGADCFCARAAGLLHDWEKAASPAEQLERARELGIRFTVELELVQPLLHGVVAARTLPERYPELSDEVWHAIAVHTTASTEMSALDQVLFVADGIEPLRKATPGIERVRSLVGAVPLDELFWESFVGGIVYVLQGGRYLYPGTLDVYNTLAARRSAQSS